MRQITNAEQNCDVAHSSGCPISRQFSPCPQLLARPPGCGCPLVLLECSPLFPGGLGRQHARSAVAPAFDESNERKGLGKCSAHSVRFVQLYNYCTVLPCLALLFFWFFFPLLLAGVSVGCFRPRDAQPLLRYTKREPCTAISLRNLADSVVSCATDTPVSNAQQSSVCVVSCVRAPYLRACRRARTSRRPSLRPGAARSRETPSAPDAVRL
jgi:hypothetical protein